MKELVLRAVEVAGVDRWLWRLEDSSGAVIAEHRVRLDPADPEYDGCHDLDRYVRRTALPGGEEEALDRLGDWLGRHALGTTVHDALLVHAPTTVWVDAPPEESFLVRLPLELSRVGGRSLIEEQVGLYYRIEAPRSRPKRAVHDRLRILALPAAENSPSLSLRREQRGLVQTIRRAVVRSNKACELRVLPYGPSRAQLYEVLDERPGWDLLHISAHGSLDGLVLEHQLGGAELLSGGDLIRLFRPARDRLKLVVISSCRGDAAAAAETLRWLDMPSAAADVRPDVRRGGLGNDAGRWAATVADELGCAVLTTRYPAGESFSDAFLAELYRLLLAEGLPLDVATREATAHARGYQESGAATAPMLISADPGLRLDAPDTGPEPVLPTADQASAGTFVGRARELRLAAEVLAPESGLSGVLIRGVAGVGKTALVREIIRQQQDRFAAVVRWDAPAAAESAGSAADDLVYVLERQLGLPVAHTRSAHRETEQLGKHLRAVFREQAVLLVLDSLDRVLTADGGWLDERLRPLVDAFTRHGGESRVVLAGRRIPGGLDSSVRLCTMRGLSPAESALLARELPQLHRLLHAEVRSDAAGATVADRTLVRRVLDMAQGNPELLQLADAAAADSGRLADTLATLHDADPRLRLGALLAAGTADSDPAELREGIEGWAELILANLPESAARLLRLLVQLREEDRLPALVEVVWPVYWQASEEGVATPELTGVLADLTDARLVDVDTPDNGEPRRYRLHPGVVSPVRATISPRQRWLTARVMADLWTMIFRRALGTMSSGSALPNAALRAVPYHIQVGQLHQAVQLLHQVDRRDRSPAVTQAVLRYLDEMVKAARVDDERLAADALHAQISARLEPTKGADRLLDLYHLTRSAGLLRLTSEVAGDLAAVWCERGEFDRALSLVQEKASITRRLQLGAWAEASDDCQRLQILAVRGDMERALAGATALLRRLDGLPPDDDAALPWRVRETTLRTAYTAAVALSRWGQALELNDAILGSVHRRGAAEHELAWIEFNAYAPLLRMHREDEAVVLLDRCQAVFTRHSDGRALGAVFSARAEVADQTGQIHAALSLETTALRLRYQTPEPDGIATSHYNLANYLSRDRAKPAMILAHRIAAGVLLLAARRQGDLPAVTGALAAELRAYGRDLAPASLEACISRVQAVEGVRFAELLIALVPEPDRWMTLFRQLFERADAADDADRPPTGNRPTVLGGIQP